MFLWTLKFILIYFDILMHLTQSICSTYSTLGWNFCFSKFGIIKSRMKNILVLINIIFS